jgi:type IV secretion system protein VirB2
MNTNAIQLFSAGNQKTRFWLFAAIVITVLTLLPNLAHAQQAMPWESFTCSLAKQVTGPWIKWMAVIAIALGGVMFGLGELSGPFQRVMQIAGGFSIALGAVAIVANMFPSTASMGSGCI